MKTIAILDPIHKAGVQLLEQANFKVLDYTSELGPLDDSIDGIIVRSATTLSAEMLSEMKNLKIVGRAGVGLDNIDLVTCKNLGIEVVNSPEGPTRSVAELVLGLMISCSRKLIEINNGTNDGLWPKKNKGFELFEKKLGIIGSGAIGGMLAKYCIGLGMEVLAYDIVHLDSLKELDGFTYVDLNYLFEKSDFISLHVPFIPQTANMINENSIRLMKDGVIIINAARGGIVDEDALLSAIESGKVMSAALDVYSNEPIDKNSKLLKNDRIITTPHIGAQTFEASKRNTTIISDKFIEFFNNK